MVGDYDRLGIIVEWFYHPFLERLRIVETIAVVFWKDDFEIVLQPGKQSDFSNSN